MIGVREGVGLVVDSITVSSRSENIGYVAVFS